MRKTLFFFVLFWGIEVYAKCSTVSESIRNQYASEMFMAFMTQSNGQSTLAFFQFDVAREKAKKAGENILKIIAIEQLFAWYRMYGTSLKLFYKNPTGDERIRGEYQSLYSQSEINWNRNYQSEWGNDPEQARLIREFMFGVGEVISGVFCATVSGGTLGSIGWSIGIDGGRHIFTSLNALWANHQAALIALKNWEQTTLKPALE